MSIEIFVASSDILLRILRSLLRFVLRSKRSNLRFRLLLLVNGHQHFVSFDPEFSVHDVVCIIHSYLCLILVGDEMADMLRGAGQEHLEEKEIGKVFDAVITIFC